MPSSTPEKPAPAQPPALNVGGAMRLTAIGIMVSLCLAALKIVTGAVGNSYALIADGIESLADIVTSVVVLFGIYMSIRPPDEKHPYGHGKAETLAGFVVAGTLLLVAGLIAWHSVREIQTPHHAPAWFTLPVLVVVVGAKYALSRTLRRMGAEMKSLAMESDALHHISDAITSAAAFVGIAIALIGGPGWEAADDWAALLACSVIAYNGINFLRRSIDDMMDANVGHEVEAELRAIARAVPDVVDIEKCRVRRSGLGLLMDIHVEVDGDLTVSQGHDIAGAVKRTLIDSPYNVRDVVVHIEPAPGFEGGC
ncbi:MAG: cation diffusion facilitator family transporter [Sumerlaeia bacterium]